MNEIRCPDVLDRLPALAAGEVSGAEAETLRAHLAECEACAAEWTVVEMLREAGPVPVPSGLEARIQAAVRGEGQGSSSAPAPRRRRVPSWGLAAAAGIVLAVATPVLVDRMGPAPGAGIEESAIEDGISDRLPSPLLDDEVVVAGAAVLDGLTDEALEQLLEEMGG